MHEAGILKHALRVVSRAADANDMNHVKELKLVFGERRAILPEAMYLLFDAFSRQSPMFKGCKLIIEIKEIRLQCNDCGHEFHSEVSVCSCKNCNSPDVTLLQGDELYVDYFEGEQFEQSGEKEPATE